MDIFVRNLVAILRHRGWTQQHLADLAGFHPAEMSRIYNGKVDIRVSTAARIASAVQIPLTDLFSPTFNAQKYAA